MYRGARQRDSHLCQLLCLYNLIFFVFYTTIFPLLFSCERPLHHLMRSSNETHLKFGNLPNGDKLRSHNSQLLSWESSAHEREFTIHLSLNPQGAYNSEEHKAICSNFVQVNFSLCLQFCVLFNYTTFFLQPRFTKNTLVSLTHLNRPFVLLISFQ